MAKLTHTAPQARDFSAANRKALLARGIAIVGVQAIAADDGDVYFSATGYVVNDNGTGRVLRFREVLALVEPAPAPTESEPAQFKTIGNDVAEWVGGMYRFYCTLAAWPYSPAAKAGATRC